MRAWLSPLFLAALLLSLLAHFGVAVGDMVWLWWQAEGMEEVKTTATTRKLKSQTIDSSSESTAELLAGVTPADSLTITLGRRAALAPKAPPPQVKPATPPPTKPAAPEKPVEIAKLDVQPAAVPPASLPPPSATVDKAPPAHPTEAIVAPAVQAPSTGTTAAPLAEEAKAAPGRMLLDAPFPKKVNITYVAKGIVTAEHQWLLTGKRYTIKTAGALLGRTLLWQSDGELDQHGLRPSQFRDYRDDMNTPKNQIDFDWATHKVRYGTPGQQKEGDLEEGGVDVFSAAYQFALQGDKLPSFTMQVIGKEIYNKLAFELKGEAKLTLSGQSVNTIVLYGVNKQRRFSFYLAPDWHNLPVRITFDDDGKITDLVAMAVEMDGKVVLSKPVRTRDR